MSGTADSPGSNVIREQRPCDGGVQENGRLRVLGPSELILRTFPAYATQRKSERVIRSLKELHGPGVGDCKVPAHPDEL